MIPRDQLYDNTLKPLGMQLDLREIDSRLPCGENDRAMDQPRAIEILDQHCHVFDLGTEFVTITDDVYRLSTKL